MNRKIFAFMALAAVLLSLGCRRQPAPPADEKKILGIESISDPSDTQWVVADSFFYNDRERLTISTRGYYVDDSRIVYFKEVEGGLQGYEHQETGIEVKWEGPINGLKSINRRIFNADFDSAYLANSMLITPKVLGYNVMAKTIPLKITMLKLESGVYYDIHYTVNIEGDDTFEIVD